MTNAQLKDRIYDLIYKWIQTTFPAPLPADPAYVHVHYSDQDAPQRRPPYATIKLITGPNRVGHDDFRQRDYIQTLTLDADLIAGNVFSGDVDGVGIEPVTFAVSHDDTMFEVVRAFLGFDFVQVMLTTDPRQVLLVSRKPIALTAFAVTGGASQAGIAIVEVQDTDGFELLGLRQITASINVYGEDAQAAIGRLHGALELPEFLDELRAAELGIANSPAVDNLTAIVETSFEDRFHMDVIFYAYMQRDSTVLPLETAEVIAGIP